MTTRMSAVRISGPTLGWLRYEPAFLHGLTWRLIGYTALAGVMLALLSEQTMLSGAQESVAPVRYGVPLGILPWLVDSRAWFAFLVLAGLNVVLLATILSNLWRSRFTIPASLAVAVVAGSLLTCAMLATAGVSLRGGSYPWYEFRVSLLTWGLAAATY